MLFSVGHQLRVQRELRGLSLQDCAHKTRIPVDHLASLENDDLAVFGSPTYSRSFLQMYARFLGVEISPSLIDLSPDPASHKPSRKPTGAAYGLWGGPSTPVPAPGHAVLPRPSPLPAIAALFIIFLFGAGLWGRHLSQEWTLRERQRAAQAAEVPPLPAPAPPLQPVYVKAIPVPEPGLHGLFSEVTGKKRLVD